MKIHSSSLTFSPVRVNPQQTTQKNNTRNDEKIELSATKEIPSPLRSYPTDKISKASDVAGSNLGALKQNTYSPTDRRTLNALNAYHRESSQIQQNQSVHLITGVDTYA